MKSAVVSILAFVLLAFFAGCGGSADVKGEMKEYRPTGAVRYKMAEKRDMSASYAPSVAANTAGAEMERGRRVNDGAAVISPDEDFNTESYNAIRENPFFDVTKEALSTFSIDVDTASYANMRRYINSGSLPPKDSVRIEELVNYFTYEYEKPKGPDPFSISAELGACPWNASNRLLVIGLQGREIAMQNMPSANLVFLLDTSGSMSSENKLPLLKKALRLVVDQLRPQDKVSIVAYAGSAGIVLPATPGSQKPVILEAMERLNAGGSTAGGAGITLAYETAKANFVKGGNNRVILCTDGDFNVGASSDGEMERLIEEKRQDGVFLTVLGFGMGNYKDSKMQTLAEKGNGNAAYIDSINEARKVLVQQAGGTLVTIAKDVKIQVEFNPAKISKYRLVGYESRVMANQDFNDDTKDAGELGAGHTVTAIYEVTPADSNAKATNDLKYQQMTVTSNALASNEWLTVKFRYKAPDGDVSKLIVRPVTNAAVAWDAAGENYRWAAAVTEFGMALRGSKYLSKADYAGIEALAKASAGKDNGGYRAEFLGLLEKVKGLAK